MGSQVQVERKEDGPKGSGGRNPEGQGTQQQARYSVQDDSEGRHQSTRRNQLVVRVVRVLP